jgi:hypothetical protein
MDKTQIPDNTNCVVNAVLRRLQQGHGLAQRPDRKIPLDAIAAPLPGSRYTVSMRGGPANHPTEI